MSTVSEKSAMAADREGLGGSLGFFSHYIRTLKGNRAVQVLDFGCGSGQLVAALRALGYDAHGCDTWGSWATRPPERPFLREIAVKPYRSPYDDQMFDVVVSTSVFEHAQNKEGCFREIHRVLKSGGYGVHVLPGKWYLPTEPHIYVPFVSWTWPTVPGWWLALWAMLGIRNEHQQGKSWREAFQLNAQYCATGISYWSWREYARISDEVYGNHTFPMDAWIEYGGGGFNRLARKLPRFTRRFLGLIMREFRMGVLQHSKSA